MNREEAKQLFREDKDAYGKPKAIMSKINKIYDDFEKKTSDEEIETMAEESYNDVKKHFPVYNKYEYIVGWINGYKAAQYETNKKLG